MMMVKISQLFSRSEEKFHFLIGNRHLRHHDDASSFGGAACS
jgi:hypothetical protein